MTARTWTESDPEPDSYPTVVDEDGVTWAMEFDEDGVPDGYHQRLITHYLSGAITGGVLFQEWPDIFLNLPQGAVLREATAEEADTVVVRWLAPEPAGGGV